MYRTIEKDVDHNDGSRRRSISTKNTRSTDRRPNVPVSVAY